MTLAAELTDLEEKEVWTRVVLKEASSSLQKDSSRLPSTKGGFFNRPRCTGWNLIVTTNKLMQQSH